VKIGGKARQSRAWPRKKAMDPIINKFRGAKDGREGEGNADVDGVVRRLHVVGACDGELDAP
jgi:hypothetical protein